MQMQSSNKRSLKAYATVISRLPPGPLRIANFGAGSVLDFEKLLLAEDERYQVVSIDLAPPVQDLGHNFSYIQEDLTKEINLERFDVITFFELLEHVDETDKILRNIKRNLQPNGLLIFSIPNLASIYSRVELLFGFQPHILEISNENSLFGTGLIGRLNSPDGVPIHHIRGITFKAMKEMLTFHGFKVEDYWGFEHRIGDLPKFLAALSPCCYFVCIMA